MGSTCGPFFRPIDPEKRALTGRGERHEKNPDNEEWRVKILPDVFTPSLSQETAPATASDISRPSVERILLTRYPTPGLAAASGQSQFINEDENVGTK